MKMLALGVPSRFHLWAVQSRQIHNIRSHRNVESLDLVIPGGIVGDTCRFKRRTAFTGTHLQGKSLGCFPACLPPLISFPTTTTTHQISQHISVEPKIRSHQENRKQKPHHVRRTKRIRHPHLLRWLLVHRPALLSLHQWRHQAHA